MASMATDGLILAQAITLYIAVLILASFLAFCFCLVEKRAWYLCISDNAHASPLDLDLDLVFYEITLREEYHGIDSL